MSVRRLLAAVPVLLVGLTVTLFAQTPPAKDKDKEKDKKPPAGKTSDDQLVEKLIAARREYQLSLEKLRQHYITEGDIERAKWAEDELVQFHLVPKRAFRLDMVVPPPTLKGDYNIREANELYKQAMKYKDQGFGTDYTANQHRAELLLQRLLSEHPQSDKISDTAYQLGDIYESKAFKHYDHAAIYFERCFQWNTKTHFDARLRAAHLYEKLNERNKAIELYTEVSKNETDPKRLEEAQKKLAELSGKK
jgi:hypothetical protein